MSHIKRKYFAALSLFALLFLQLAVAAYACPAASTSSTTSQASDMRDMPCGGSDAAQLKLCEQHQVAGDSATKGQPDPLHAPVIPALLAPLPDVHAGDLAQSYLRAARLTEVVGPPLALRYCVLRL